MMLKDFTPLEKVMGFIIGVLIMGWGSWVTVVSLNNADKKSWMVKMQGQIDKNTQFRVATEGKADHH